MIVTFITESDIWDFVNGNASIDTASAVFDYLKGNPTMAQQVGVLVKRRLELVEADRSSRPELEPHPLIQGLGPFADIESTVQ